MDVPAARPAATEGRTEVGPPRVAARDEHPTEYVITLRVRTTRTPRDDPWPQLRKAADALFKVGGELDLIGATVEQVPSIRDKERP